MSSSGSENFLSLPGSSEGSESSEDSEVQRLDQVYKNSLWSRVVPGGLDPSIEVPLFLISDDLKTLDTT